MNENQKKCKIKNYNNKYTLELFKYIKDDDFLKSSSEDLYDSVLFKNEIKQNEENDKIQNENNVLYLNKNLGGNKLKMKESTSSINKENDKIKKEQYFNKESLYEEIEKVDKSENKKSKLEKKNYENKNNLSNKENSINKTKNHKNNINIMKLSDINSNSQKNIDKNSLNLYNMNTPVKNNYKIQDNNKDKSNLFNNFFDNSNNSKINSSKKINKNKNNIENYFDFEDSINKKNFKNLKQLYKIKKNRSSQIKFNYNSNFSKKASVTIRTNSRILEGETDNVKNRNKKSKLIRRRSKRVSQTDFSLNSTYSSKDEDKKEDFFFKKFIIKYLLNFKTLIIMVIVNILSLFSNDIKHIWLPKSVDIYFDIFNLIFFLYFIVEIILLCFFNNSYLCSFLFILDIIGTICILFDIEFINNFIFGYNLENNKINMTAKYIHICIIMLERVIRSTKVIRCVNLNNLVKSIKRLNKIYLEKKQRDLVKEEKHKKKLMEKIQNLEDDVDGIEESFFSNESILQTKNDSKVFDINYREESQKSQNNDKKEKKVQIILQKDINEIDNKDENVKIKESHFSRKMERKTSRKRTIKLMKQNTLFNKNTNRLKEDKKSFNNEMKEINKEEEKEISEEIYQKIDDTIQNSKISNKVKNSMRIKIIISFLILLSICIFLDNDIALISKERDNLLPYSFILDSIINFQINNTRNSTNKIKNFLLSLKQEDFPIINITKNNKLLYENNNLTKLNYRQSELLKISSKVYNNNSNQIINILYSVKKENKLKHIYYLLLTLISCISIVFSYIFHESDLTNILLTPIEVMIEVADKVSKDPMNAKNINELEQEIIVLLQKNVKIDKNKRKSIIEDLNKKYNDCYNSYEVKVIMNAIIKISALLAMSVGEAGGQIIHKNLSSTLELHLHSRGKKKYAIFGFCNIRNFEEINLVLEEKTIPLINQIAEIVHSSVDRFRGNTNKNMGDSFLNVWKFYNNLNIKNNSEKKLKKDNLFEIDSVNPQINITADCSVLAFLRCILKINKNQNILKYRENKKLNKVIPNFKVNMGFGLHLGYGIEGPVGSVFKMEASYLSPNVNIAARLETATKQFGVNLLISGKLYNIFTEDLKNICRYVDCVRVKGSTEPIDLYTIDINSNIQPQKEKTIQIIKNSEIRTKILKEKKMMIESLINEFGSISPIILEKKSYIELIDEKSDEFYDAWENAILFYKNGNWEKARKYFEECLKEDKNDGPSKTLYNYIKKFNFKSPNNWKGERELTSK